VYALYASTIDLTLSVFPWAKFRKTKGAIKLHAMIDLTRLSRFKKKYTNIQWVMATGTTDILQVLFRLSFSLSVNFYYGVKLWGQISV
jgi:hypothetical protein